MSGDNAPDFCLKGIRVPSLVLNRIRAHEEVFFDQELSKLVFMPVILFLQQT